ncbi:hypothetical protein GGI35DRAFT_451800 [Trichoderma velutinum]
MTLLVVGRRHIVEILHDVGETVDDGGKETFNSDDVSLDFVEISLDFVKISLEIPKKFLHTWNSVHDSGEVLDGIGDTLRRRVDSRLHLRFGHFLQHRLRLLKGHVKTFETARYLSDCLLLVGILKEAVVVVLLLDRLRSLGVGRHCSSVAA